VFVDGIELGDERADFEELVLVASDAVETVLLELDEGGAGCPHGQRGSLVPEGRFGERKRRDHGLGSIRQVSSHFIPILIITITRLLDLLQANLPQRLWILVSSPQHSLLVVDNEQRIGSDFSTCLPVNVWFRNRRKCRRRHRFDFVSVAPEMLRLKPPALNRQFCHVNNRASQYEHVNYNRQENQDDKRPANLRGQFLVVNLGHEDQCVEAS